MPLDPRVPGMALSQPRPLGDTMVQQAQLKDALQSRQINQFKLGEMLQEQKKRQDITQMASGFDMSKPEGQEAFAGALEGRGYIAEGSQARQHALGLKERAAKLQQDQADAASLAAWALRDQADDMAAQGMAWEEISKNLTPEYLRTAQGLGFQPGQGIPDQFDYGFVSRIAYSSPKGREIYEKRRAQSEPKVVSEGGALVSATGRELYKAPKTPAPEKETLGQPVYELVDGKPVAVQYGNKGSRQIVAGAGIPASKHDAPTEDERKSAFLVKRLEQAQRDIGAAGGGKPEVAASVVGSLPLVGDTLRNVVNSTQRQRVEAAQLDALDAALTLATGAAYTRIQLEGLRQSYFPQIGDDPPTVADKQARFENLIQAAKLRAGRATPGGQQFKAEQPEAPPQVRIVDW